MSATWTWSVFTKWWSSLGAPELAGLVSGLGFSAIELPIRPGCQVTPDDVAVTLPRFAAVLRDGGVSLTSVAADLDERVLAACAEVGVPLVRIMPRVARPYRDSVARLRDHLAGNATLVEKYGVTVGVQHHHGAYLTTATAVRELLDPLPTCYGVVWDAGHEGLAGQDVATSLEAVRDRLVQVNLKNAVLERIRVTDDLGERQVYGRHIWVDGPDGFADWARALATLRELDWTGPVCVCAEYSGDQALVAERARADLRHARSLLRG